MKPENLARFGRHMFKNGQGFVGQKTFPSPGLKFRRFFGNIFRPLVGIQKSSFATNLIGLWCFAMRTDKFGPNRFRNGTETFFAIAHRQNGVRQYDTIARTIRTDMKLGFCALTTDTSQEHQYEANGAQTIDRSCKINLAQMLITRALVARRTPNRMIDEAHTRICDSFQFRNATIVGTWIRYFHDRQTFNFFICLLAQLKTT